jgi:hypothetical protein
MTGTAIELESFHRIVQSRRTSQFTEDDPDSQIEVTFDPSILRSFDPSVFGTGVKIRRTNAPDDHLGYESGRWQ